MQLKIVSDALTGFSSQLLPLEKPKSATSERTSLGTTVVRALMFKPYAIPNVDSCSFNCALQVQPVTVEQLMSDHLDRPRFVNSLRAFLQFTLSLAIVHIRRLRN
jgi:hypothetical protein